jgi:hypothetical protein
VRKYVGRRKREILGVPEVMVPQVKDQGVEAEVDFFEATVKVDGVLVTVLLMQMRACYSGRVFVKSVVRPTQQAFFEAMVAGFAWFGAVFHLVRRSWSGRRARASARSWCWRTSPRERGRPRARPASAARPAPAPWRRPRRAALPEGGDPNPVARLGAQGKFASRPFTERCRSANVSDVFLNIVVQMVPQRG